MLRILEILFGENNGDLLPAHVQRSVTLSDGTSLVSTASRTGDRISATARIERPGRLPLEGVISAQAGSNVKSVSARAESRRSH